MAGGLVDRRRQGGDNSEHRWFYTRLDGSFTDLSGLLFLMVLLPKISFS